MISETGEPIGRPKWYPTEEDTEKAMVLSAVGVTQQEIADAQSISVPTLKSGLFSNWRLQSPLFWPK